MIPLIGGLLSAWHGGRIIHSPKLLKGFAWAVPFCVLIWFFNPYLAILGLLCMLKNTGHGRGFELTKPFKAGTSPEKVEYIIPKSLPVYWQKVLINGLTGLLAVSGAVIAFLFINPLYALLIAYGGAFKAINAMIFDEFTEAREFADGVAAYTPIAIILGGFLG